MEDPGPGRHPQRGQARAPSARGRRRVVVRVVAGHRAVHGARRGGLRRVRPALRRRLRGQGGRAVPAHAPAARATRRRVRPAQRPGAGRGGRRGGGRPVLLGDAHSRARGHPGARGSLPGRRRGVPAAMARVQARVRPVHSRGPHRRPPRQAGARPPVDLLRRPGFSLRRHIPRRGHPFAAQSPGERVRGQGRGPRARGHRRERGRGVLNSRLRRLRGVLSHREGRSERGGVEGTRADRRRRRARLPRGHRPGCDHPAG